MLILRPEITASWVSGPSEMGINPPTTVKSWMLQRNTIRIWINKCVNLHHLNHSMIHMCIVLNINSRNRSRYKRMFPWCRVDDPKALTLRCHQTWRAGKYTNYRIYWWFSNCLTPISSGFPIATFDYRRVIIMCHHSNFLNGHVESRHGWPSIWPAPARGATRCRRCLGEPGSAFERRKRFRTHSFQLGYSTYNYIQLIYIYIYISYIIY